MTELKAHGVIVVADGRSSSWSDFDRALVSRSSTCLIR